MITGKLSLIVVSALIIGIAIGVSVGLIFPSAQLGGGGLSKEQIEKVKKLFPVISEMRALSGTVEKIDAKTITLKIAESANPLDEWPIMRKVTVADATKIVRISQKDPGELQKEEIIKLSDLKVGDVVAVEAGGNIKSEAQFTATKITVGGGGSTGFSPIPGPGGGPPVGAPAAAGQNLPTPPPSSFGVPAAGNLPAVPTVPPPVR